MNYFPNIDDTTGKLLFPLSTYGAVNPQFARTLTQANSPLILQYAVANDGVQPTDIVIDPEGLLSLGERFQTPVSARALTNLFGQLHHMIVAMQELSLPLMNIVFDTNYIYTTTPEMNDIRCIYLPITGGMKNINAVKDFFTELPTAIKPAGKQAEEMLTAFGTFMHNQEHLNVAALATFLHNLATAQVSDEINEVEGNDVNPLTVQAPEEGVSEIVEAPGTMVLNAVGFAKQPDAGVEEALNSLDQTVAVPPIDSTQAVGAHFKNPAPPVVSKTYFLCSKSDDRECQLSGSRFTVGKSKRANFQIPNTTTVSRIHAYFACGEDECWITDNRSLNGTFVNDVQLKKGASQKLNDGDVITLSDETFVFRIEESQ